MRIPGENLKGVFSQNELLDAWKVGKKAAVIGGGSLAVDAAKKALRIGFEVYIIYRRFEYELPASIEEVNQAMEEGVKFDLLLMDPMEILGDENGRVKGIKCTSIGLGKLGEIKFSEFVLEVDTVILPLWIHKKERFL